MKKLLILLIAIALFTSCVTQQRCERKFPTQNEIIVKDTVIYKEVIVIKDSIINVMLPSDTVFLYKYLTSRKGVINLDTLIVERGIVGAMAFVNNNQLGVIAYISDSSIYYKLDSAHVRVNKYKQELHNRSEIKTRDIVKNSDFAKFTQWWFFITAVLIIVLLYLKIK